MTPNVCRTAEQSHVAESNRAEHSASAELRPISIRYILYVSVNKVHLPLPLPLHRGVYTRGGMVRDAPWRKLGGKCCDDNDAFARVL